MEGSKKLQPAPSVLPSLGADGGLFLVTKPEVLDDLMLSFEANEPGVDLVPRYPHEHSVLSTVLSTYQELVELDQDKVQR